MKPWCGSIAVTNQVEVANHRIGWWVPRVRCIDVRARLSHPGAALSLALVPVVELLIDRRGSKIDPVVRGDARLQLLLRVAAIVAVVS